MSTSLYPVHVDASLDEHLNRWLWLVKWLLVIPHYIVLAFLWVAFALLSIAAFFAILFTGRYPRTIFDFNVGVLRWSWRVAYYAYGGLGTDRYPPFALDERPDYPAHLSVEYPERLSRGLVLVKWWLLALPHYLVVAFFVGGGWYVANEATNGDGSLLWGSGLIGLLVLIAAVVLLFTGRYPQPVFDLVLGMNRWVLRVAAYAALMTDDYPPFRLDMGGADPAGQASMEASRPPGGGSVPDQFGAAQSGAAQSPATQPPANQPPATQLGEQPPQASRPWTGGRVTAMVIGSLLFVIAGGLIAGGVTLAVADNTMRDDQGYFMTEDTTFSTEGYAIQSEALQLQGETPEDVVPEALLGDAKLEVTSGTDVPIFVGVAATADAASYLAGVDRSTVTNVTGGLWSDRTPVYRDRSGTAPAGPPTGTDIWVASAFGSGQQTVTWPLESGNWTLVVMNADGSRGVAADIAAGATLPGVGWVIGGLLTVGGLLLLISLALIIGALRSGRSLPPAPTRGQPATYGQPATEGQPATHEQQGPART